MNAKLFSLVLVCSLPAFSPIAVAAPAASVKSCCGDCKSMPAMTVPKFAETVATVDMLEIQLGHVAQTNASLASVKKFGAYMVKSHTAINKALAKVAARQNVAIPVKLDPKHQAIATKLSALKGENFDKTYIPAMVEGHTKVLAMMKAFSASCQNPAFKKFAVKTTPIIAKHLACAEKIQAQMKAAGLL